MGDTEKAERTKLKRAVTKQINYVKQLMAEGEKDDVKEVTNKLKWLFKQFKVAHEQYHDELDQDDEIEGSEVYFTTVQNAYVETLTSVKQYLCENTTENLSVSSKECTDLSRVELLGHMNLPKITLETFDGNPVKYHTFIATFDQNVDRLPSDEDAKLLRLMQYTSGVAKEAIRMCSLIGGKAGYDKAREILSSRFGDDHLVAERLIGAIRKGGLIKTSTELRRFADDLESSSIILKKMGKLPELDTQAAIVEILSRLQPFIQNRWKRRAVERKRERGIYPDLCEFVEYVSAMAVELNDPVYGNTNARKQNIQEGRRTRQASFQSTTWSNSESTTNSPHYSDVHVTPVKRQEQPCVLCKERHRLWYCQLFKDMRPKDRLDVVRTHNIPVGTSSIDVKCHAHLRDIPLVQGKVKVELLIGQDNAEALIPLAVRRGRRGEPFATRTLLGWSVNGPTGEPAGKKITSHFISIAHSEDNSDVDKIWNLENEDITSDKLGLSANDEKVIKLWDEECRIVDGHYELPIPWKEDKEFPNNLGAIIPRLNNLKKRLNKKGLLARYDEEMDKLLQKGYAEKVPDEQISTNYNVWYIPHQPVVTEKKPGKLRIVFDCAAKYRGESLNDKAYQGPDLNNKLTHGMLRFRQDSYAIMADIEAMYNQVKVPEHDRDALRFIWYDKNGTVRHFRMTSHLFGGVWCASAATYAVRRITRDQVVSPLVKDTLLSAFYVDDCLKSVGSREEAEQVTGELRDALSEAGFHLTKFVTNVRPSS